MRSAEYEREIRLEDQLPHAGTHALDPVRVGKPPQRAQIEQGPGIMIGYLGECPPAVSPLFIASDDIGRDDDGVQTITV